MKKTPGSLGFLVGDRGEVLTPRGECERDVADISKGIKTGTETGWEHRDREGEYESEVELV